MNYTYLIEGITIATDIYFPELMETDTAPQVELLYGDVPEKLEKNNVDFPFIEANEHQYLLKLDKIGRYLVENGTKITIQKDPKASAHDLEKYVLTNVFGALSYQQKMIPMHGGVFIHNGKGILVSGISGNGKSTILSALFQKGYQLISDDISNVEIIDGKLMVHPCYPRILIWKDTAERLKIDLTAIPKMRSDMEKYLLPIDSTFVNEPVELTKIIVLTHSEVKEKTIEVKGLGKIESLRRNTFKPWMVNIFGSQKEHFLQLSKMANMVQLEIFENNHKTGIEKFIKLFMDKLNKDVE